MDEILKIIFTILKALGYAIQVIVEFFLYDKEHKFYQKHTFWYFIILLIVVIMMCYLIIHSS